MKELDIKLNVLPVEHPVGDAGSKGKFLTIPNDVSTEGILIQILPEETDGDAGSKGIFNEN